MITSVLFDLDGLLTDTETLHCLAYRQMLGGLGVELSEEEYAEHWIRAGRGITDFIALRDLPYAADDLRQRKLVLYERLVAERLQPMPGALDLLARLHGRKRLALATSCYPAAAEQILGQLRIARYFEVVATSRDVARLKPHPDLFLFAAERLGAEPWECLVIEDAEKGIRAAAAAGMASIAVPNRHTRGNDFSLASRIVASLDDVTVEMIDALAAPAASRPAERPAG